MSREVLMVTERSGGSADDVIGSGGLAVLRLYDIDADTRSNRFRLVPFVLLEAAKFDLLSFEREVLRTGIVPALPAAESWGV